MSCVAVLDSNLRYLSAFPVVVVPDLESAARWYGAAFGFARLTSGSDGRSEWLHLRRGEGQDLVLRAAAHPRLLRAEMLVRKSGAASTYMAVDQPLGEATDTARRAGAKLIRGRRAQRDEANVTALRDPYGYEWALFSRATPGRAATVTVDAPGRRRWTGPASFRARWRIRLRR
ncbi:MAG TPA: VOC family protein [Gemmatimonadales bacterium]|nr:VOC family protein [Gemmatimonadales bacterium]